MITKYDSNVGAIHQGAINPFLVSAESRVSMKYKPRLYGEFLSSEDFLYAIEVLEIATEEDEVELHVSSCGGSGSAISTLIHAMKKCRSPIHVVMTGTVASAGTIPMFYSDSWECAEDCSFLFHEAVLGTAPETMSANKKYTEHAYRHTERLLRNTYEFFFSEDEFVELFVGDQKWMFPEEVEERFTRRIEAIEEIMSKQHSCPHCQGDCGEFCEEFIEDEEEISSEQIPVKPKKKTIH